MYFSRFYQLGSEAREECIKALQKAKLGTDLTNRELAFGVLANVGFIALIQDWPDLSDAILTVCLRELTSDTPPSEAGTVVGTALIAAATLPEQDAARRLGELLLNASARLSEPARRVLHEEIITLKQIRPQKLGSSRNRMRYRQRSVVCPISGLGRSTCAIQPR
jgi:hypothetical protein